MRKRLWLVVGATWALSTVGAGLVFSPAHADSSGTAVGDASEAWYDTSQAATCSSPVGCLPITLPTNSYAANTLHVGVSTGNSSSETFVSPDLSAYIGGTLPTSGTMTLPLATVANNGNSSASTATIKACLSKAVFKDGTFGVKTTPPATDCSVTGKLVYTTNAFTLDLSPFLAAWANGTPDYGIALLPDLTGSTPLTSWQVAFNGRNLSGATPISSTVSGGTPAGSTAVTVATSDTTLAQTSPGVFTAAPVDNSTPAVQSSLPADSTTPAVTTPAVVSTPTTPATTVAVASPAYSNSAYGAGSGFQYPEILLLPLLIAGGMLFVLRLLTSDATPKRLRARTTDKEAK